MRIAIDCDECLVNTGVSLYEFYKTEFPIDGINPHSYSSTWPAFGGDIDKWKLWFRRWGDSPFYTTIKPMIGAQDAIKNLHADGHKLYVVSKSSPHLLPRRTAHLEKLFGNVFSGVKLLDIDSTKQKILAEIRADFFIDDDIKNIMECKDITQCIAFKNETNTKLYKETQFPNNVEIANGWMDVLKIIKTK